MASNYLKPLVRALRLRPVQSRAHATLSRQFEEAVFRAAHVLSEGYCSRHRDGGATYSGSTMLTVELDHLGPAAAQEVRAVEPTKLVNAMEGSVRLRIRATRLALTEARRRCTQGQLGTAQVETRVHMDGSTLRLDVELEAPVFLHAFRQHRG